MYNDRKSKLERYFKNASRFLWGLGPGNQKETYAWLRNKGFDFTQGPYAKVAEQLIQSPGIESIIRKLIIPRVKERFSDKAIEFLRNCWHAGTLPDVSLLKQYNIRDVYPFLEINTQFDYVERWGEFAGFWFEEIESVFAKQDQT